MSMKNIIWQKHRVGRRDRERLLKQKAAVVWFTGLSGSGKSTIASLLGEKIHEKGFLSYVLDGDNIRHGLSSDLGFSDADRMENIRRVGEVSVILSDAGVIVLAAFISPHQKSREAIRKMLADRFIEVYVKCSVSECKKRDPKGHYQKARTGGIKEFTGVSAPYETPLKPEIVLDTENDGVEESAEKVFQFLKDKGLLE
ncbi:MAG: adenylyl-sulfate kinase [Candidatus Altiarchaeales archaeon]|nr:adenylyl-sulfate kinase [Candidatus Altiarchaeales archaeon]